MISLDVPLPVYYKQKSEGDIQGNMFASFVLHIFAMTVLQTFLESWRDGSAVCLTLVQWEVLEIFTLVIKTDKKINKNKILVDFTTVMAQNISYIVMVTYAFFEKSDSN